MTMRRIASAVLAGTALVGAPLVTAGVASANPSGSHHDEGKGSLVYAPVNAPVQTNTCGNTINTIGELNPAFGNTCVNGGGQGTKDRISTGSATDNSSPSGVPALPSVPSLPVG